MKKHSRLKAMLSIILALLLVVGTTTMGMLSVSANSLSAGLFLRGNMNGWNCYDQYKFVDEGNGIYTLVLDMTGGNYEFKIATPNWSTSIGNEKNDNDNAYLVIEADSIIKFTADTKTRNYTAESMNTKSDFTLGTDSLTIAAEKYTYALGAVNVWGDSKASAGKYVGAFDEGDSLNYGVTVKGNEPQTYKFEILVASETDEGYFDFIVNDEFFYSYFTSTGAWQTYKTVVVTKTLNPGYNRITIDNLDGTYNVDKIVVTPVDAADIVSIGGSGTTGTGILGDADGDSKVNIKDATAIQKHVAGLIVIASDVTVNADADGSGGVNVKDATAIQKFVASIETGFAIGEAISKGATSFDFKNFDAASDASLIKNGTFTAKSEGEYVSIIVKPELDGVYKVTLDADATIQVGDTIFDNGSDIVIEGETEIIVIADKADTAISNIKFEYLNNIEIMGYQIYDGSTFGYRFKNTMAVEEIIIDATGTGAEAGKLVLSNGKEIEIPAIAAGSADPYTVNFETPEEITWFAYTADETALADIKAIGKKVMNSDTDIALDGFVSVADGWMPADVYPYQTTTATEGKVGFGFNKEVTVEKIVVIGADDTIPAKANLTTADNKTVEITGTKDGNNVVFDIEDTYSFGFYLDFGQEVTYSAVQVYGNDTFKGGITNVDTRQDYTLFNNGLTEDDSRVIANTGDHILTSETGSDREWYYEYLSMGEAPYFSAPNTPLAEAAYNLTMDEIFKSINYDETFGDVFYTGTNWHKVWTRDTAISMQ